MPYATPLSTDLSAARHHHHLFKPSPSPQALPTLQEPTPATIRAAMVAYMEVAALEVSTRASYGHGINTVLGPLLDQSVSSLNREVAAELHARLGKLVHGHTAAPYAERTVTTYWAQARSFAAWLVARRWLPYNALNLNPRSRVRRASGGGL